MQDVAEALQVLDNLEGYNGPGLLAIFMSVSSRKWNLPAGKGYWLIYTSGEGRQHWKSWGLLYQTAIGEIINLGEVKSL